MLATLSLLSTGVAAPPQGGAALQASTPQGSSVSLNADVAAGKPKKECSSLTETVSDEWCNEGCNAKGVQNCPEEMCTCYDPAAPLAQPAAQQPSPAESEVQCEGDMCIDMAGNIVSDGSAEAPSTCKDMQEITADQLQCVFPMLGIENANRYAASASARVGPLLGTDCAWAAFLGNVAIESKELTLWTEIKCKTEPPFCGHGPLQLTGQHNYNFCASEPICDCPDIENDIDSVARDSDIGFGTSACVWGAMFGYSLSELADGTRDGMLKTCCTIHQGHFPCEKMSQYSRRVEYWETATICLGTGAKAESAQLALRKSRAAEAHHKNKTETESPRPKDWGRPKNHKSSDHKSGPR